MAKKKTNPNEDIQGDIIYDRMPGADAIKKEDAEGFNVDMNFETKEEGVADEEAQTAQEDPSGEETNLETSPEEIEAEEPIEAEAETGDSPEGVVEEAVAKEGAQ